MTIKNIIIIGFMLVSIVLAKTNTWELDITAQAQSNTGEMQGISDYIKVKMQAAEPFEDCGIDRCCDKFEDGFGGCFQIENPSYNQGDDPNSDNFNPLTNLGYEKNGKWDGDIYNDSNQDCSYNNDDFNNIELNCQNFEDENICLDNECNWDSNLMECYKCIHLESQDSCLENGCNWDDEYSECDYNEAFVDRVGLIGFTFGPDGIYTQGEKYYNLNDNGEPDESLDFNYPECRFEEGGTDGWRQGEDEFDIPAPMDGHTNIRFSHLDWMNQTDINGNTCCMEGIFFSVDKKSWKDHDEVAQWDIYGNTWQLGNIDRIKFSWDSEAFESLYWIDSDNNSNPYEVYIFADSDGNGKFNSNDDYVNMNTSQFFAVDEDYLVSNGQGAKISIVIGECALMGTDEYIYDNDGDGLASSNCLDCPKEFCPASFTGEYYAICESEYCIENPDNYDYIDCPEDTFTKKRILNLRGMDIDIENNDTSNDTISYSGADGIIDNYISTCKYNSEIKISELDDITNEFLSWGNGNPENYYVNHTCVDGDDNCERFVSSYSQNGDTNFVDINTNVWIQKWYKLDDIDEEDTNDVVYCETNAVDDCELCATLDVNNDGIYEDYNAYLGCNFPLGDNNGDGLDDSCFNGAEYDDCGICQTNPLNANFKLEGENFIKGPDLDCNGECLWYTPTHSLNHNNGDTNYGMATINSCGICTGGNTIHNQSLEIDQCGVCPAILNSEPFFDSDSSGVWNDNEEFIDLIEDGIFTQIEHDYFYAQDCWIDNNNDGEWTDAEEYIDIDENGQWDLGEPLQDDNGDSEYTPAEPFKFPGTCLEGDINYSYNNGPNCDGECFNQDYTIYSDAFFDDCSECSCINGLIDNDHSFCNSLHLPNSGDSEPEGTFEDNNSCIDLIFYNDYEKSIQNFTALSIPAAEGTNDTDTVILEWEYNPELYVSDVHFKILKLIPEDSSWVELDTISNVTCNDNENGNYGICSSNSNQCLISNYGNDCKNLFIISNTSLGDYGIKVIDSYNNESEILAEATAEEFDDITLELYNGNNLISFSALPSDHSIASIFEPIQEFTTGLIGAGVASSYIGNGQWVGVITEIDPYSGYWLKIEYPDTNYNGLSDDLLEFILYESYRIDTSEDYNLQTGANLISYLGDDNSLINDAINSQQSKYFKSIIGEGFAASHLDLNNDGIPESWAGSLAALKHQKGYWIILDLNDCPTSGDNVECNEDDFGNAILEFNWE